MKDSLSEIPSEPRELQALKHLSKGYEFHYNFLSGQLICIDPEKGFEKLKEAKMEIFFDLQEKGLIHRVYKGRTRFLHGEVTIWQISDVGRESLRQSSEKGKEPPPSVGEKIKRERGTTKEKIRGIETDE